MGTAQLKTKRKDRTTAYLVRLDSLRNALRSSGIKQP